MNPVWRHCHKSVLLLMLCWLNAALATPQPELPAVELTPAEEAEVQSLVLPIPENWTGDFEGMRERRLIRVLVPYSKTFFELDRGRQRGLTYELGKGLEAWLNKTQPYEKKSMQWRIMFIPTARNELMPKLNQGVGDIAAGGLTVTEERLKDVDFSDPFAVNIPEILVTSPGSKPIEKLEDLSGQEITVRASSSYYEHLQALNASFKEKGLAPIDLKAADENLESEDLLQMVNAGLLKATVVDRYLAIIWAPLYKDMKIHEKIVLHDDSEFAWAIRKDSPQLKSQLAEFVKTHKVGTAFGNSLKNKYVTNSSTRVLNATSEAEMKKFQEMVEVFTRHASTYGFDHLMLMAQGFQESQLDQKARSPRGAVGVMQMLPKTAKDPTVDIGGIDKSADKNIEAGSKYMRLLADKYLNDPQLTQMNKTLMTFAAYNAGPGNLRKFRALAEKSGLDKNIWFGNVEQAAAQVVGRETVDYVGNIYKYYVAYKLVEEKSAASPTKTEP
ncbi:lytic transglycosylase F [Pseudomonas vancouverensis]|uniref:Lytic transglycosylase F n=1 Tax=Pseudomonas vancouverensis TaxID=95300 RepID=A0A1H2PCM5_PSEVA|nr:lytic transglycosylase F [Pseudomonas vancouverensis]KAB0493639.1 lytic transglycosylase F [Pseudomonas vancouverensis]TDB67784.1 lytic transglycosylase F [Pseudomonas vancouverensis]SDV15467.1 Membrane-bound lytic murein transglycosylase MltF [Pseudomonas vancouverensis]